MVTYSPRQYKEYSEERRSKHDLEISPFAPSHCRKCDLSGSDLAYNDTHCADIYCSCHQPPTEEYKCVHGHSKEEIDFYGCETNPKYHGVTVAAPKDSPEWEAEFEKKWRLYMGDCKCNKEAFFKPFIKEQIAKAKEEERARIRGVIDGNKEVYKVGSYAGKEKEDSDSCCNEVLTDILKEIGE